MLVLQQEIDSASHSEASEETAPFPSQTGACGTFSSSRLPSAGEEADCRVFCTWTPVTVPSVNEPVMGRRSHPLSKGRINALECGRALLALVQERKAKELPSSSSQKAIAELLKAVAAAPGLHWPLSQYTRWKTQLFCLTAAAQAST